MSRQPTEATWSRLPEHLTASIVRMAFRNSDKTLLQWLQMTLVCRCSLRRTLCMDALCQIGRLRATLRTTAAGTASASSSAHSAVIEDKFAPHAMHTFVSTATPQRDPSLHLAVCMWSEVDVQRLSAASPGNLWLAAITRRHLGCFAVPLVLQSNVCLQRECPLRRRDWCQVLKHEVVNVEFPQPTTAEQSAWLRATCVPLRSITFNKRGQHAASDAAAVELPLSNDMLQASTHTLEVRPQRDKHLEDSA